MRKPTTVKTEQIIERFRFETGITEDVEVQEAFPASLIGTIMLENSEWSFRFTYGGRAKKGSFTYEGPWADMRCSDCGEALYRIRGTKDDQQPCPNPTTCHDDYTHDDMMKTI